MNVCLIVPPSSFLLDEKVFMSLGILRVAAVLESAGLAVEVLDLSGIQNYADVASRHATASSAPVFGLTATTPQMPAALEIARALRRARPAARIILGGPHVTLVNAACRSGRAGGGGRALKAMDRLVESFDCLVAGDGEEAIFRALQADAPKLIDADDAKSPMFLNAARLNELPLPARHLLDVASYRYEIEGERALSLIAQLGCPFGCGFCGGRQSPSLRRVRTRSTDRVIEEITRLHEDYGINGFMFYDDELNVNSRMLELMVRLRAEQDKRGVEWRLRGFVKADLFSDAQASAMYRAGFRWILAGFESGSPRMLANMEKRATREENSRCLEIARRHGLKIKALMSLGHPGESEMTARLTHEWLLNSRPDDFDVTIITTYPGSPYYDRAVPHASIPGAWTYRCAGTGDQLHSWDIDYTRVAEYYKGDPNGGYRSYVFTDDLEAADLVRLRDFIEHDVRARLGIPFPQARPSVRFESSMGQLPSCILRRSTLGPIGARVEA